MGLFRIDPEPRGLRGQSTPEPGIELRLRVGHHARPQAPVVAYAFAFPVLRFGAGAGSEAATCRLVEVVPPEVGGNQHFCFTILVSTPFDLLERVEHLREVRPQDGVDIELDLQLSVLPCIALHDHEEDGRAIWAARPALGLPQRLQPQDVDGGRFTISRDEWIRLLGEIGFADVLVFEFPRRPLHDRPKELSEALAFLQQARRAFDQGDYDLVAGRAFNALEALAPGKQKEGVPDRVRDRYLMSLSPLVQQRAHELLVKLTPLLHVGRHATWDANGCLIDVTRRHAAFVLGAAELVVGWCAMTSR